VWNWGISRGGLKKVTEVVLVQERYARTTFEGYRDREWEEMYENS
jgi:hypothetical protein